MITKSFVPLASPGLAAVGTGALAVSKGTLNVAQVSAVVLGLLVVAIAGMFTIRSNVAKIWREQAEGEKARNLDLTAELVAVRLAHSEEVSKMKVDWAAEVGESHHATTLEREAKERALADLDIALAHTDMTPVMAALDQILEAVRT